MQIIFHFLIQLINCTWLEKIHLELFYYFRNFSTIYYKIILSSMLFPKLPLQKPKLSLAEKSIQNINEIALQISSKKQQKEKFFQNSRLNSRPKNQIRSLSSSSNKNLQLSRNSLKTRKLSSNQKQNKQINKFRQDDKKSQHKISLKLSQCLRKDQLEPSRLIHIQQKEIIEKIDKPKKDFPRSEKQSDQKIKQSNSFSSFSTSQNTLKIVQYSLHSLFDNPFKKINQTNNQTQKYNLFSFQNSQETKIKIVKSQCPLRDFKRQDVYERSKNFLRTASINCFQLESSVFSIKIEPENNPILLKKRLLIQSLLNDNDFEWKYEKFREYAEKYSQYEIRLKKNFETLQLLTENVELLKERVIPCKQYDTIKEVIQIVKPTLTQKDQKAYETKMTLLEWKKKFFSKIKKIKDKLNDSCQKKCETILLMLQDNQDITSKAYQKIDRVQKKETVIFQKEDILLIKNALQTISLNQKQMIDDIRLFQSSSENFQQKLIILEEEWSHAFDIFNFTLENCAKKCITLSETIEKFYGKCSTAIFLTKGIEQNKEKELKLIQNDKCHICRWNETKLKKIIEQNSLAKDYVSALKHLVTH